MMRLMEILDDARMRHRVAKMRLPDIEGWFSTSINGLTEAYKHWEQDHSHAALNEVRGHLRAMAALHEGLAQNLQTRSPGQ